MKFLSHVWSIARGSVGGITYTANQYHQLIARAKTSPVNPGSGLQTAIRTAFTEAESLWKALDDRERTDWDIYAAATPRQNPLGPITLTGRAFMRGVVGLRQFMVSTLGTVFTPTDLAPATPGMLNIGNVVAIPLAGVGTGVSISWTNPPVNPDINVFIQISGAFEPTRQFYKGPWDTAKNTADATPSGATGFMEFTGLVVDKVYFMRLRAIHEDGPHKISEDFIVRSVAITVP